MSNEYEFALINSFGNLLSNLILVLLFTFGSRVCGNPHGLIRKYGLMCCRQCFCSNAKDIGFLKVNTLYIFICLSFASFVMLVLVKFVVATFALVINYSKCLVVSCFLNNIST